MHWCRCPAAAEPPTPTRRATPAEVKQAYRRLAKANHPDAAGEAALPRFLAIQAAYTNRKGQWNWGVAGGLVPSRFVGAHRALTRVADMLTRETAHLRYLHEWGKVTAHYHLNRVQRLEFGAGVRRWD